MRGNKKRDEEILKMIKEIVRNWDKDVEKLTRITRTAIGKKINRLSQLEKRHEKLPKTISYIHNVVESIEEFQIRRVEFVIEKLKKENEPILKWKIYRKVGPKPNVSNEVKRFIS